MARELITTIDKGRGRVEIEDDVIVVRKPRETARYPLWRKPSVSSLGRSKWGINCLNVPRTDFTPDDRPAIQALADRAAAFSAQQERARLQAERAQAMGGGVAGTTVNVYEAEKPLAPLPRWTCSYCKASNDPDRGTCSTCGAAGVR